MSSNADESAEAPGASAAWPPRRPRLLSRNRLRNGTWIIPGTGERTRRQFTLRGLRRDSSSIQEGMRPVFQQDTWKESYDAVFHNAGVALRDLWLFLNSQNGHGVLKCALAYLLASLGTFWAPAAHFLGELDGKHIVATIVVYFHPARSAGSQMEAVIIAVIAVFYSLLVGILSMATSVLFGSVLGMVKLSYALILIVFVAGAMGFIAWVKQKFNTPLVGVGASIASIGIITIITKENSVHSGVFTNQKILQSLRILLMATTVSTAVNLLVWRVSARVALRQTMRSASVSLGKMLRLIASGFLSGSEEELNSKGYVDVVSGFRSTLTKMNKHLRESKFEYYFLGQESVYKHDKAIVKTMETLAQSLGGLRSAANTQFELLKEVASSGTPMPTPDSRIGLTDPLAFSPSGSPFKNSGNFGSLSAITEAANESSDDGATPLATNPVEQTTPMRTPADIFELFIARLGPSMKSLSHTMAEILKEPPFNAPGDPIALNEQFKHSLEDALSLYNEQRGEALEELYKTIEFGRTRPETLQADFEEVAAACGHFSFSLLSLAHEMQTYLDALEELRQVSEQKKRTWTWLMFWRYIKSPFPSKSKSGDLEARGLMEQHEPAVRRMRQSAIPTGIPRDMIHRRDTFNWDAAPKTHRLSRAIAEGVLKFFRWLSQDDIRFGVKVGFGAAIWAMFAFFPQTRPIYQTWRGEWGLLSFMIVCSMTVGASNTTGFARFIGTIIGAAFVLINWRITEGNAIGLALLGALVSLIPFYLMVHMGAGPLGRFILLSYNVSSLYAYSLTQKVDDDDDDEGGVHPIIQAIVFHRVVAVSLGILWGLVICRVIWPISARTKFKEGVAVLYLQMGLIWKRGPLAILLRSDTAATSYLKNGEQAAMQRYISHLQALRNAAQSEWELRGPFPSAAYGRIMSATQRLLDDFHAMSLVTLKHGKLTEGEKALLHHTADERAQLCARICHVFQVLASSIMLEYPLSDSIPSVMGTRDKLLGKIFRFRKEYVQGKDLIDTHEAVGAEGNGTNHGLQTASMLGAMSKVPKLGDVTLEEPDYALLYAYALVTGHVAKELKVIEREIENLFGKLDEDAMLLQ